MRLFIRVPIFVEDHAELRLRRESLLSWADQSHKQFIERYGFVGNNVLGLGRGEELRFHLPRGRLTIGLPSLVPKGLVIRLCLDQVLFIIDDIDHYHRHNAFFIMIDGSGAFEFDNVYTIVDRLLQVPKCDVVFGVRPEDNVGMAAWRKNLEDFEEYLLCERFPRQVPEEGFPDTQAGCWGLRLSSTKSLSLTGSGFELEYDLLVSVIERGVSYDFVGPLNMRSERGSSTYGKTINEKSLRTSIDKLAFIAYRLDFSHEQVFGLLKRYLQERGEEVLPAEYVSLVRKRFWPDHPVGAV